MHEVEHEVVLHGDVKGLHRLSLRASSRDSSVNTIFRFHESLVLALDLIHDVGSVNIGAMSVPVDSLAFTASLLLVIVVQEAGKLAV